VWNVAVHCGSDKVAKLQAMTNATLCSMHTTPSDGRPPPPCLSSVLFHQHRGHRVQQQTSSYTCHSSTCPPPPCPPRAFKPTTTQSTAQQCQDFSPTATRPKALSAPGAAALYPIVAPAAAVAAAPKCPVLLQGCYPRPLSCHHYGLTIYHCYCCHHPCS
jgi:hypothetical protein